MPGKTLGSSQCSPDLLVGFQGAAKRPGRGGKKAQKREGEGRRKERREGAEWREKGEGPGHVFWEAVGAGSGKEVDSLTVCDWLEYDNNFVLHQNMVFELHQNTTLNKACVQ